MCLSIGRSRSADSEAGCSSFALGSEFGWLRGMAPKLLLHYDLEVSRRKVYVAVVDRRPDDLALRDSVS
jgi:hypothetical protein